MKRSIMRNKEKNFFFFFANWSKFIFVNLSFSFEIGLFARNSRRDTDIHNFESYIGIGF